MQLDPFKVVCALLIKILKIDNEGFSEVIKYADGKGHRSF